MLKDVEVLVLRATVGGLMAGHGAQKLMGAFEGPGLQGTAGMMKSLGFEPADRWALAAALSEFGGGVLTALGLFNPLGPIGIISAMTMATATVHWNKPVWASKGGAELPVINIAAALAVAIAGPGEFSLDHALGIQLPKAVPALAGLTAAGLIAYGLTNRPAAAQSEDQSEEAQTASA
ncbi:MAG TPA: DoxX family protein [Chloroflexota bacterium]|nr:DoxX family protein [Chloroflexota bacterium]